MEIDQTTYGNSNVYSLLTGSTDSTQETKEEEDVLGLNSFLTMLVAQLENQDPLNPLEGTDFASQLAQYSALEQQIYTNNHLEDILEALGGENEQNLIDYIGKEVKGEANAIALQSGVASDGYFELDEQADAVVYIYDSDGTEISSIYKGQLSPGTHSIDWDGRDSNGNLVADGAYTFEVIALKSSGGYISVSTSTSGKVTGVTYENGTAFLDVNGQLIDPGTVTSVQQSDEDSAENSSANEDSSEDGSMDE